MLYYIRSTISSLMIVRICGHCIRSSFIQFDDTTSTDNLAACTCVKKPQGIVENCSIFSQQNSYVCTRIVLDSVFSLISCAVIYWWVFCTNQCVSLLLKYMVWWYHWWQSSCIIADVIVNLSIDGLAIYHIWEVMMWWLFATGSEKIRLPCTW